VLCFISAPTAISGQHVEILSADQTAYFSTHDTIDHFFERVQPLEVAIQLKDPSIQEKSQKKASEVLKKAMYEEAVTPTKAQKKILATSIDEAIKRSSPLLQLYPLSDTIRLGVIKGNLYGGSVFYTREQNIFIPEPMIQSDNTGMLTKILIHEIFHLQSRKYPELQEKLYRHIGFHKLDKPLRLSPSFLERTLLNPDGTDWDYFITLATKDEEKKAIPLIVSKKADFDTAQTAFFAYVKFQLYELQVTDGKYEISYTNNFDGLNKEWMKPFFEQITYNTQYIIHPDELIADNFVLLTEWLRSKKKPEKISADGEKLLHNLAKEYKIDLP
ncbi:MAG: hypothetical protein GVX78_06040, partial [Bacteroidetes bacterium]|nr:hypothetical protein [Bacteroidota bacterium]